jgi:hypothetical protein
MTLCTRYVPCTMYYNEYAYKAQPHQMVTYNYKAMTLKSNALHLHTIMFLRQLDRWNQVKKNQGSLCITRHCACWIFHPSSFISCRIHNTHKFSNRYSLTICCTVANLQQIKERKLQNGNMHAWLSGGFFLHIRNSNLNNHIQRIEYCIFAYNCCTNQRCGHVEQRNLQTQPSAEVR